MVLASIHTSIRTDCPLPIMQVHVTSSHMYFAMEHASGGTLDQLLRAKASKPVGAFGGFVGSRGMLLLMASYPVVSGQCAGHAAALPCSLVQPTDAGGAAAGRAGGAAHLPADLPGYGLLPPPLRGWVRARVGGCGRLPAPMLRML